MFNINWNAFPEQITDEVHEERNTSMMIMTEVQAEEEEQEGRECMDTSTAMPTKSHGKKRVPASYPDEIALKIIDEWPTLVQEGTWRLCARFSFILYNFKSYTVHYEMLMPVQLNHFYIHCSLNVN